MEVGLEFAPNYMLGKWESCEQLYLRIFEIWIRNIYLTAKLVNSLPAIDACERQLLN